MNVESFKNSFSMTIGLCLADTMTSIGNISCNNCAFLFDWMPFEFFNSCRSTSRATEDDSINHDYGIFDIKNKPFYYEL